MVKYFFLSLAVSVLTGQPLDGEVKVKVLGRKRMTVFMDQVGVPVGSLLVPFALDEDEVMVDGNTMVAVTVVIIVPLLEVSVVKRVAVVVVVVDTVVVVSHLVHGVVEDADEEFMLKKELVKDVDEESMLKEELVKDEVGVAGLNEEELMELDEEAVEEVAERLTVLLLMLE
jgi:hypothetical protein